jgi:hypothetical protein
MWTCKNCGEEVPDNFSICWNCQYENGSSVMPKSGRDDETVNLRIILKNGSFANFDKITSAGKQLKQAVVSYLVIIGVIFFLWILAEAANWQNLYYFMIFAGLLGNVIIFSKLYYAGSALQKCVEKQSEDNS